MRSTEVKLAIANKMYVKEAFPIEPAFTAALEKNFNASAEVVDFLEDSTINIINKWVEEKTDKKIMNIVSPGTI